MPETLLHQVDLKIDGSGASPALIADIIEVIVELDLYLPAMFIIRLNDRNLDHLNDSGMFAIGKEIEILLGTTNNLQSVMKGEITAIEPDLSHDAVTLVIRGYDKMHRLHRGRQIKTYQQITDSDIIQQLVSSSGLAANVSSTSVQHKYIIQHNQSDLEFCQFLAARNGYTLYVHDGTVYSRPLSSETASGPTLAWADNLRKFQPRVLTREQVNTVKVQGWDPNQKQAITGQASSSSEHPEVGETATGGSVTDGKFGSKTLTVVQQPMQDQNEATKLAQAIRDQLSASYIQIEGECAGDPTLRPGQKVEVKNTGPRFSGKYQLTGVRHIYNRTIDYIVQFTSASPRQPDTFSGILSSGSGAAGGGHERIPAVAIGVVSNNKDDEEKGRIKVKLPWLGDNIESYWARIASPLAGSGRGMFYLPEVNDEVLLAFEHGNPNYPVIIGYLWSSKDKTPITASDAVSGDGKVNKRVIKSRSGHIITLDDTDGSEKITIVDKTGNNKVEIHSEDNSLLAQTQGDITLESKTGKVSIKAAQDVSIESTSANCNIKAGQEASVKANTNLNLDGATGAKLHGLTVEVNGDTSAKLHGLEVEVTGDTIAKVAGSAILELSGGAEASLKAAIVMIN